MAFLSQETDLSIFDLIGLESQITRHEAELLSKKKVTRKLMEEVFTSPPPTPRPAAVKLKASRCVRVDGRCTKFSPTLSLLTLVGCLW